MDANYLTELGREAVEDGARAYSHGGSIENCPYAAGTTEQFLWRWAWLREMDRSEGTE